MARCLWNLNIVPRASGLVAGGSDRPVTVEQRCGNYPLCMRFDPLACSRIILFASLSRQLDRGTEIEGASASREVAIRTRATECNLTRNV